jgi:hypothetical protein
MQIIIIVRILLFTILFAKIDALNFVKGTRVVILTNCFFYFLKTHLSTGTFVLSFIFGFLGRDLNSFKNKCKFYSVQFFFALVLPKKIVFFCCLLSYVC